MDPFAESALSRGVYVADVTGYGPYGWATTVPVADIAAAGAVNFRIAQLRSIPIPTKPGD